MTDALDRLVSAATASSGYETSLALTAGDSVTRPDGRVYRSRKIAAYAVTDDDEGFGAVVVLGTHDVARAQPLADAYVRWQVDGGYVAADPVTVWWRDAFSGGRRCWAEDPVTGRAGVWFRRLDEVPL